MATGSDGNTMRWVRLGSLGFVLAVGWAFIAWQNSFHITPPLVFVMLGYLAVVLTTYNLWRTGASAVAQNDEDDGDASWGRPTGARGELDREKRTMLKAIKEAEFDLQMGKLSPADAHQMISMYRARAIEVMKELEQLDLGTAGTVRERIMREVKARVAIEGRMVKDKQAPRTVVDDDTASYGSGIADADDVKAPVMTAPAEEVTSLAAEASATEPTVNPEAAADAKPEAAAREDVKPSDNLQEASS